MWELVQPKLKMYRAAKAASSCSKRSLATNHGRAHNSRLSTCTTDGELITARYMFQILAPACESVSARLYLSKLVNYVGNLLYENP